MLFSICFTYYEKWTWIHAMIKTNLTNLLVECEEWCPVTLDLRLPDLNLLRVSDPEAGGLTPRLNKLLVGNNLHN